MEDIAPKLFEKIKTDFESGVSESKRLIGLKEKLRTGSTSYKDAHDFAIEVGNILSDSFLNNLSSDVLPDGKLYYNIADRVVRPMLGEDFDIISSFGMEVQSALNKEAGIGIKAIAPDLNEDKVQGIVDIVSGKDDFDKISYMLKEPIINFSQTIVDDTVRVNADFQYKSGLSPKIRRTSTGNCCEWCYKLAGVYNYEDVKDTGNDVLRRHKSCKCLVEFDSGDGKRQNVHTKEKRIGGNILQTEEQIKYSSKLKSFAFSEAKKRGMNPLSEEKVVNTLRRDSKKWIEQLTDEEKRAISKYSFNGKDADGKKLYEKINGYLNGKYKPVDKKEEDILLNFYSRINGSILKNRLENDIIVYRKEYEVSSLHGETQKFLSTSVTRKGVLGGIPNVAILVPKGAEGAYIELLSKMPKQREFLLCDETKLNEILSKDGLSVFEVIKDE